MARPSPPFFAFTLFSPFILSRFFSFFFSVLPFPPQFLRLFSPPILCPFSDSVFVRSSPRSTPAPFFAFFARFHPPPLPLLLIAPIRFSRSSALSASLPSFAPLFTSLFPRLFSVPFSSGRPPIAVPPVFSSFSLFSSRPSALFPSFLLRFTHPFPPRPFSCLLPSVSLSSPPCPFSALSPSVSLSSPPCPHPHPLFSVPALFPSLCPPGFFRPLHPLSLFPAPG